MMVLATTLLISAVFITLMTSLDLRKKANVNYFFGIDKIMK